jgi:Uma2 family endonuclease
MVNMAPGVLVSVEDYLRTSYAPDRDYVDGAVVERNFGEFEHSSAQREILLFLAAHYPGLRKRLQPEQRVQVGPNRFRIPDVCILAEGAPRQSIIDSPPELCIEILSPEDTLARTMERVRDYFNMGVPRCWIVDPVSRNGWVATPGRLADVTDGILRAHGIEMPLSEVLE